jgi:hypothetical protein
MRSVQILTFAEGDVPEDLRAQQVALQEQAWPSEGEPDTAPWHDPALRAVCVLLVDDARVVSALDLLSKPLAHDGETWEATGLSTVVTDRSRRGAGLASTLVRASHELIAGSGADLGLFTSDPDLRPLYEGAGWEVLPGTVLVGGTPEDPFPSDALGKLTFGAFFTARAIAAHDRFVGSRIELFPGTVDRLW